MPAATDADRAVRGASLRLVSYVLSTVLSVVSAAVLLRYLGVADYGRYVTVFALFAIVAGITEAGTANIGVRELSVRDGAEHPRLLAELQGMRLTLTLAGAALALAFALVAGYDEGMRSGAALAGAGLLATVFVLTLWVPLSARLELATVAALELLRQVLTVAVLLALVAAGAGVAVLLGAQLPVALGLLAVTLAVARAPLRFAVHPRAWRALLVDTVPYAAATAIGLVYASTVVLVMSLVAPAHETGLFGAASRVYLVMAGSAGLLVGSAFPLLARAARDDRERLAVGVQRVFDAFAVASVGLAIVAAAGAPVAIEVVAGPDYDGAAPALRLLAAALVGSFAQALGAFALLSLGRQKVLMAVNALALAAMVALALVLAEDAVGGATATLAGECVIAVLTLGALARAGVRPSPRVLPRVAAAAALAAVPALLLPALPAALGALAVYAVAVWRLGLVPPELLRRS